MKTKTSLIFLAIVVGVLFFSSSCRKELPQEQGPEAATVEQLKISPEFDWKTTKEYTLNIQGPYDDVLSVLSPDGITYQRVFLKRDSNYEMKLTLPSSASSIKLTYYGKEVPLLLNAPVISYTFK